MKTASQQAPISLRRIASTIAAKGSSSHLQGEDSHGAEAYPLPGIDEAPLSIGDSSARERLWRLFTFQMGQQ
jgi:hypothetical protein